MKNYNLFLVSILAIFLYSCGNGVGSGEVKTKEEYYKLKNAVIQCKEDFRKKKIDKQEYSKKMENFGDVYVKSVDAIPPERRYKVSIFCYKEALKYNKDDKDLKVKLQDQQALFQVVNQ